MRQDNFFINPYILKELGEKKEFGIVFILFWIVFFVWISLIIVNHSKYHRFKRILVRHMRTLLFIVYLIIAIGVFVDLLWFDSRGMKNEKIKFNFELFLIVFISLFWPISFLIIRQI